jgi:hypothetical protein
MHRLSLILALVLASSATLHPCTTAIVSGKHTRDGRPLMLKHRDSDSLDNRLMYFDDGKYQYIGLVNSGDREGKEVWSGYNSAGFAIMNSADYNLNLGDTTTIQDREGYVMKQALQTCATLEDFERLLRSLPRPMGVEANFGVIDAQGGAAYYETGNASFTKFDANDPATAPFGYLIRTNFAFTGDRSEDYGLIRYRTADEVLYLGMTTGELDAKYILQKVSRSLTHSLTKTDLTRLAPSEHDGPVFVPFRDFIPRFISSASILIQGVKPGEQPAGGTIWTILGFPPCSVAIPVWLAGGNQLPALLVADNTGNAPLCTMALRLKRQCFPISRESGRDYLQLGALLTRENTGIMQRLHLLEESIFAEAESRLVSWRRNGFERNEVLGFYNWTYWKVQKDFDNSMR